MIRLLILICFMPFFYGCSYFSTTKNHDQDFIEAIIKKKMADRFILTTKRYESEGFGPLTAIKDTAINLNGKSFNIKHQHWFKIQNKYVIKDSDGNVVREKSEWVLIDSTITKTFCCLTK